MTLPEPYLFAIFAAGIALAVIAAIGVYAIIQLHRCRRERDDMFACQAWEHSESLPQSVIDEFKGREE